MHKLCLLSNPIASIQQNMFTLLHIEEIPYSYPAGAENEKNGTKLGNLSNSTNAPLREDNINKSMHLAAILIMNALFIYIAFFPCIHVEKILYSFPRLC